NIAMTSIAAITINNEAITDKYEDDEGMVLAVANDDSGIIAISVIK
ncbi:MAG: hypothetical protein ACI9FJ_000732, partial [Alteromonadaceae bacterium]